MCGGSAVAVAASLWATVAVADTAVATADQPGVVTELTVIANKRVEKIESVPVAITAFSAKQRDIIGIRTMQEISDFTPGLSYYAIADRAYIRGIGRNTTTLGTASGVAIYYNGIYYGANGSVSLQHDSLFIGNVEVDRGPQNTLHGSNADGGVINYIEKRPTDSFFAEGRAGVANYGYYYGEAVVSGPLSDNWKFRVGGNWSTQNGGYFHNLDGPPEGGSGPQGGGGTWRYLEAQIEGKVGDHFDVWAMASSGDFVSNFHTVATVGAIPQNFQLATTPLTPNNFFGLCAINASSHPECGTPGTPGSAVAGSAVGFPVVASSFPGDNPSTANPHNFIETSHQHNSQNDDIALATTMTYHFPNADLEYLGGYQQFFYHLQFGSGVDAGLQSYQIQGPTVAAGNATIFPEGEYTLFDEHDESFSHELDLISTNTGPLQYLAGLYWYHEHFNQPIGAFCYPNQPQIAAPAATVGITPAGTVGVIGPGVANPDGCAFNEDGDINYDDYAGFAHLSYKFNEQLEVAGGLRYTDDHKAGYETTRLVQFLGTSGANSVGLDVTQAADAGTIFGAVPANAGPVTVQPNGNIRRSLSASWNALTGDVTVNWTPTSDTLAYFRYARGYKSGGFAAGAFQAVPATVPEYVDAFEVGLKKTIGQTFTANAAAFYYNFANDQQPFTVATPGGNIAEIFNVPAVREYGLELEGIWRPIEPLTLNLQYSYLNTRVTKSGACVLDSADPFAVLPGASHAGCAPVLNAGGVETSQPQNILGAELPEAPPNKVSLNGQYVFNFDPGKLTVSASFIWKDKTYGSIFNRPDALAPAYSTVNLRAIWDDAKDRYSIILFVNNLANTIGYDNVTETRLAGATSLASPNPTLVIAEGLTAPRTFGAEFQVRFK
jgi:iron complex outermembrane receptor protein